ncbi:MAG: MATE family efflux transporter [Eggerthellaceae bacterium]
MGIVLLKRDMWRQYARYVLPSMLTYVLFCLFNIVDGLFVGNLVGDAALAGVNVAWPWMQIVMATGTGIGMGAAVIASIEKARGRTDRFNLAFGNALAVLLMLSIPITVVLMLFAEPLCYAFGGRGGTLQQATIYLQAVCWCTPCMMLTCGAVPLMRNKGNVNYAMGVMLFGGLVNIALDIAFVVVLGWGTWGAGTATSLSELASSILAVAYFLRRKNRLPKKAFRLQGGLVRHMAHLGLAPAGLSLLPEMLVVAININAAWYGGELALAAYAVIAYVAVILQMLIQGMGDGAQPLISHAYGAGDFEQVRRYRNTNYCFTIGIGIAGVIFVSVFRYAIPTFFGASGATADLVAHGMPIFSIAYVFYGFTHASTSFFYAVDYAKASTRMVYSEALLVFAVVFALAALMGVEGLWWSPVVIQGVLAVVAGRILAKRTWTTHEKTEAQNA